MRISAVDSDDKPIGVIERKDVFALRANFRVIHILMFNAEGKVLLQRLPANHKRNPCLWGSSVAGYLFANEDYRAAARRRLREELSIQDVELRLVGKTSMIDEGCTKFIEVFDCLYDGEVRPDRSHIDEVRFFAIDRVLAGDLGLRFTPTSLHVLKFYRGTNSLFR